MVATQKEAIADLAALVSDSAPTAPGGHSSAKSAPLKRPAVAKHSAKPATNGNGHHAPDDFADFAGVGASRGIPMDGDFKDF